MNQRILARCVALGILVAAIALWQLGLRAETLLLALLLAACPSVIVWGAMQIRRLGRGAAQKRSE